MNKDLVKCNFDYPESFSHNIPTKNPRTGFGELFFGSGHISRKKKPKMNSSFSVLSLENVTGGCQTVTGRNSENSKK